MDLLSLLAGNQAPQLLHFSQGIDDRPVQPIQREAKSYSEQETFAADTTDETFIEATLHRMADRLMSKIRENSKSIRTITVKVRYNDMDEQQAAESLPEPADLETEIYFTITQLLKKAWQRRVSLRLVSLKLSNVYLSPSRNWLSLDNATHRHEAEERLARAVDALRQKFGSPALLRGHDFVLRSQKQGGEEPHSPIPDSPGETALRESSSPYRTAVVQRQRLGNSFVKASRPPGPLSGSSRSAPTLSPGPARKSPRPAHCLPLNVHSHYSFLDSTLAIADIVKFAVDREIPAIALTDRENLHGAVEFALAAEEAGIRPIIGTELATSNGALCLYVQNQAGYANLCDLLSETSSRIGEPPAEGAQHSATRNRQINWLQRLKQTDTAGLLAVGTSPVWADIFPNRFYLGITHQETESRRIIAPHLPRAAFAPVHYQSVQDRWKYDIVQSIRTLTLLRQTHPEKRLGGAFHFPTTEEIRQRWGEHSDWLSHTQELAERCAFKFNYGKPQFPAYQHARGSAAALLRELVMAGLRRRYPTQHAQYKRQVEEELEIITEVGYEEYFLIMWDVLEECRRKGIEWITRGSAADSLACYCLGISDVCPIRFDLYFRRFLNKERMALNKLPDIDVDFPHDRKDDVVDLMFAKFGPSYAAVVGGFSTFQARSAFAETAKVLGVSEFQVRRMTERLPHYTRAMELREAVNGNPECGDLPLTQEPYATALAMGQFLDGFPRYPKMHPCGLVLSRQPLRELVPCFLSAKGYPATHFDMDSVEAIGLVKMDILAQGGLSVMRDTRETVTLEGPSDRPPIDLKGLKPWNDPQVWELIASGNARAVHHIESPAMISLCKMCNVRDIDTLIAIVSVIRPGAANESKKSEFALRYQGLHPVYYPHPSLENCLRSTFGLVVYEEHILQICESFAGLPPGRADVLRRALAKEKDAQVNQIKSEFLECAQRLSRSPEKIEEVWNLVTGFRGYAFCKAHSTAYGVEAYEAAWLKLYYPAEFMAAVLTNGKGFYSPLVYVLECHRLGIGFLPPWANQPGPGFKVVNEKIRVPMTHVKGTTTRTADRIIAEHKRKPFASLADFILRVQPLPEEMEGFIQAGAFDGFGQTRTTQYWEFKALARNLNLSSRPSAQKCSTAHQLWLIPPGNLDRLPAVSLEEPNRLQRLRKEEELFGYPVSSHPLDLFPDIAWDTYCPINRLAQFIGQQVVTCGLVIEQRLFHQVTGEPMKFITIADPTGIVETELFARTYRSYGMNTVRYRVLEVTATVESFPNQRGFTLRVLHAGKPRKLSYFRA
jgi:error-prone DNA polymerase